MKLRSFKLILVSALSLVFYSCKYQDKRESLAQNDKSIKKSAIEKITSKAEAGVLVCAHRSYHKLAPENSFQSLKDAIAAQIDIVEIDIRTTKDSLLVLMHDDTIDRTTDGTGLLSDYTFSQLQEFTLKIGDSLTSQKIPLLSDVLKLSKGNIILNLDLKAVNYDQLYNLLLEYEMEYEVISFIAKKEKVMEMRGIDSLYAILPLTKTKSDIIFYSERIFSPLQHFVDDTYTDSLMTLAHEKKIQVFINTLWDEDNGFIAGNTNPMNRVIALMPAIIQTDHPVMLLQYLRSKNLHD